MSKPSNWDSMSVEDKRETAEQFFPSMRAQLMIGRALRFTATRLLEKEYPEPSDGEDMEILGEMLFPVGFDIETFTANFKMSDIPLER